MPWADELVHFVCERRGAMRGMRDRVALFREHFQREALRRATYGRMERADDFVVLHALRRPAEECDAWCEVSGCSDRHRFLKQFAEMQKLMRQTGTMAKGGRLPRFPGLVR